MEIYTVGHSTRTPEEFQAILSENGIQQLADVRRFPGSRRHPQFTSEALGRQLEPHGIAYRHFPDLGGFRKRRPGSLHTAWRVAGFAAYADHMDTLEFAAALEGLETWARQAPTVAMCAEALPVRCHRRLLSDALLRDGFRVIHLLGALRRQEHQFPPFARLEGERIIYDGDPAASAPPRRTRLAEPSRYPQEKLFE